MAQLGPGGSPPVPNPQAPPPQRPWLRIGVMAALVGLYVPFLLLIGFWIWILRRSGQATQGIFSFGRSRARMQAPGSPKTTFQDVAGVEQAQFELQEIVDFLRDPQRFQRLGGKMPKGVLLI